MLSPNPSIRKRLIAGTMVAIAVATLTGSIFIYLAQRKVLNQQLDERLVATAEILTIEIELENGKPYQEWLVHIADNDFRRERDLIQVWDLSSGQSYKAPALGAFDLPKFHGKLNEPVIQSFTLPNGKEVRALGIKVLPSYDIHETTPVASLDELEHIFVIALETSTLEHSLTKLRQTLTWVVVTTMALTTIYIFWIVRLSLIPIRELSHRLQKRETDHLGNPITISENFPKELRILVNQYNSLLTRIEKVRTREREFSVHAAHELRTPIAGIQATLEQALSGKRDPEDYDQRIQKALSISRQMTQLVGHLMRFSRLQTATHDINLEEINLRELIEATWQGLAERCDARKLTPKWNLEATSHILKTDENLARILITNLIDNAISYARENSTIELTTANHGGNLVFSISNFSATPLPSDAQRLFEPFYRIDQARNPDTHHAGIGLSLCREIARALEIEIRVSTTDQGDFKISLIIPPTIEN